jgi:hypothetical protein
VHIAFSFSTTSISLPLSFFSLRLGAATPAFTAAAALAKLCAAGPGGGGAALSARSRVTTWDLEAGGEGVKALYGFALKGADEAGLTGVAWEVPGEYESCTGDVINGVTGTGFFDVAGPVPGMATVPDRELDWGSR